MATLVWTLKGKWQAFSHYAGPHRSSAFLRWFTWAARCLLRLPAVVDIPHYGMRLYLAPRWKGVWKAIFAFRERFFQMGEPELEFTRRSLKPGDVFVDAGAYHGWYALVASKAVGERGRVVAFEPNPDAFAVLGRNIDLNGRRNIHALNVALSNVDGRVRLYKGPTDGLASSLGQVAEHEGYVDVEARRLDGVLHELNIDRVACVKIDVEGFEAAALKGCLCLLRTSRPAIVLEINPATARIVGIPEREAWDLLEGLGYRLFRLSGTALVPLTEFPSVSGAASLNAIAIHADSRPPAPRMTLAGQQDPA